jgi:hypothetical protein
MHPDNLEDERFRRRGLAAAAAVMAVSLERMREGGRDLGVPCPARVTPHALRRWAADLEHANAIPVAHPTIGQEGL